MTWFLKTIAIGMACAVSAADDAYAQTRAQGEVRALVVIDDAGEQGALFGDFTLSGHYQHWFANVGFFGVVGRLHETYASIGYQFDDGTVTFGFPRPAYDQFVTSSLTTTMPRVSLDTVGVPSSRATVGTMTQTKYLPLGATYAHQKGQMRIEGSLHYVPDYATIIAGVGASLQHDHWTYEAAVEGVDQDGGFAWNAKAQATRDWGGISTGAALFVARANAEPSTLEVFADYTLTPSIAINGVLRGDAQSQRSLAVGLQYEVRDGYNFNLGLADGFRAGTSAEFGLSYQF